MSWLLGVIMAAGMAHGQPPMTVALAVPPATAVCAPAEFSVTVDNRSQPARRVALAFGFIDTAPVSLTHLEIRDQAGVWTNVPGLRAVADLPADGTQEYHLRAEFPGGRHTLGVWVTDRDLLGSATTDVVTAGPEIHLRRPVPDRISAADWLEFGVTVRNQTGGPPLSLEVRAAGAGRPVLLSVPPWPWWPVTNGVLDLGRYPPGADRTLSVRLQPGARTGSMAMPVEARLLSGPCVAASDGFAVEVAAAPPGPDGSAGLMFGVGVALGVAGTAGVLRARRRVRT